MGSGGKKEFFQAALSTEHLTEALFNKSLSSELRILDPNGEGGFSLRKRISGRLRRTWRDARNRQLIYPPLWGMVQQD